jgi:hypothetical protein
MKKDSAAHVEDNLHLRSEHISRIGLGRGVANSKLRVFSTSGFRDIKKQRTKYVLEGKSQRENVVSLKLKNGQLNNKLY